MHFIAEILLPLAQNISLFVAAVVMLCFCRGRTRSEARLLYQLVIGLGFALCAVLAMSSPFVVADGLFVDSRSVVISIATIGAGWPAGLLCALGAAAYRLHAGGVGAEPALASLATTFALSVMYVRIFRDRKSQTQAIHLAGLGFLSTLLGLAWLYLLIDRQLGLSIIQQIALPFLALISCGMLLAGKLLARLERVQDLGREIAEARHRLELALRGSQDGVFDYDVTTRRIWTSARYRAMREAFDAPEVTSLEYWRDYVIEEDRPAVSRVFGDLESGKVDQADVPMRLRLRSGRVRHMRSKAVSERDAAGRVIRIVGSNTDETDRILAEGRLRDAINSIESGVAFFDAEDRLILCNEGFLDPGTKARFGTATGHTFEEIMRAFATAEFSAVDAQANPDAWLKWRLEMHKNPPVEPLTIQWTDGRWFSVLERKTSDGGRVGIWTDVTVQKQRELELEESRSQLERQAQELVDLAERVESARLEAEQAKQVAERASREKSAFLASMSHELRTPLNAVIGFAELMKQETFGKLGAPQYTDYVALIAESGNHLLSLINDVLDMAKIESGNFELTIEPLQASEVCNRALALVKGLANKRGIGLSGKIEGDSEVIHADHRGIHPILLNLLSNAIKFTEPGGSVSLHVSKDRQGVMLSVADTGIGMDEKELNKALQPYGQVQSDLQKSSIGTGLGLPLVKKLAEMHGGTLSLTSAKGKGTIACVKIPSSPSAAHAA